MSDRTELDQMLDRVRPLLGGDADPDAAAALETLIDRTIPRLLDELDRLSEAGDVTRVPADVERATADAKPEPLVPEVGKLYEFDTIVREKPSDPEATHVGWWNGLLWIACFGLGTYSPQYVTGFRPYNPVAAEPVGPMVEPTSFGALVDTDDGPAVRRRDAAPSWRLSWALRDKPYGRFYAWSELANARPYKADGCSEGELSDA